MVTRKKFREETLAELLDKSIEEVFEMISMPTQSIFQMLDRIQKKETLGLDVSVEKSIVKCMKLEKPLQQVLDDIKAEPALMYDEIDKLLSKANQVVQELENAASNRDSGGKEAKAS